MSAKHGTRHAAARRRAVRRYTERTGRESPTAAGLPSAHTSRARSGPRATPARSLSPAQRGRAGLPRQPTGNSREWRNSGRSGSVSHGPDESEAGGPDRRRDMKRGSEVARQEIREHAPTQAAAALGRVRQDRAHRVSRAGMLAGRQRRRASIFRPVRARRHLAADSDRWRHLPRPPRRETSREPPSSRVTSAAQPAEPGNV